MKDRFIDWHKNHWLLLLIIALGATLRFWGIDFGLPYTVAPDEAWHLTVALRIFLTGDLNPHWLNYPSLMFYLNALAYIPFFLVGKMLGILMTVSDIPYPEIIAVGVGKSLMPAQFILARSLTALFGTAAIGLVYAIARKLHPHRGVALLAAFFFAVSPASIFNSHLIRPDTFVVFFVLLSCYGALGVYDQPNIPTVLLTGIAAGLAVSSKYNVPLVIAPLLVAHFLHWRIAGFRHREIYAGLLATAVAFVATTPFAILDFKQFLTDMSFEASKQISGGHTGTEGNTLQWYLEFLWNQGGLVAIAAVAELFFLARARSKRDWVWLSFPILYFVFICTLVVRNDRTILPILPFISLLAALFLIRLYNAIIHIRVGQRWSLCILLVITLTLGLPPLQSAVVANERLTVKDSRDTARIWIEQNLPSGSRVMVEAYSPYISRERFVVEGNDGIIARPPEWYIQNGFEYLVFSYGAYGRFYEDRALYGEFVNQYDALFARFTELKRFNDNGYEIRIYTTGVSGLPKNRVAARLGIFANWFEIVGYDITTAQASKPIEIILHWRNLQLRREAFQLTAHLLNRNDETIAQTTVALQPTDGIVRVPIKLDAPADPGLYRLQLELDTQGLGRVPVLGRNSEPVSDKLFVGPFKIAPAPISTDELQHARNVNTRFGDNIALSNALLQRNADAAQLTLYWQSIAKPAQEYTVFVHLIDANGKVRTQVDAPPRGGAYPTSLWDAGETIRDEYTLNLRDLAPGDYCIEIGLYDSVTQTRLAVNDASGKTQVDHLLWDEIVKVSP